MRKITAIFEAHIFDSDNISKSKHIINKATGFYLWLFLLYLKFKKAILTGYARALAIIIARQKTIVIIPKATAAVL